MFQKIEKITLGVFSALIKDSNTGDGTFRITVMANIDGSPKPLLILGSTHARYEDGYCIAILNPDKSIVERLNPAVVYCDIKEICAGRCDMMAEMFISLYQQEPVEFTDKYKARYPKEAKYDLTLT